MTCHEHASNCCAEWCKGCQRGIVTDEREQAVIKAAEAWLAWGYKDVARSAYSPETWEEKLAKAVRALQEARDE